MSSGAQVDLLWDGADAGGAGVGGIGSLPTRDAAASLSDEELLGIESADSSGATAALRAGAAGLEGDGAVGARTFGKPPAEARATETRATGVDATGARGNGDIAAMPAWVAAAAADPAHGAEAQALWRSHQEFCAAFSSPGEARAVADEARAIKELLPGGVKDVAALREATASVERIDAALFSGDARAQGEVVAELARANPAAFRSLFAEAARVLAGMGAGGSEPGIADARNARVVGDGPALRKSGEGWGDSSSRQDSVDGSAVRPPVASLEASSSRNLAVAQDADRLTRATNHEPRDTGASAPTFDPAAYAAFERGTNDAVGRDVRAAIGETLGRVMPDGVADGAARRIGEDIFTEVHRVLAADRGLSEQVASVLRDRRFDAAQQQRVAGMLAARARQIVPGVARRVIGEWTSSVLSTARAKASRQAVAASRVDIAAPGGSADSMPLRAMSAREVNYASMSDEQILGM